MTIVAGMLGPGFAVLGSDSEESKGLGKATVRKIAKVEKGSPKQVCCLIGGAGSGSFIDSAVQQFDEELPSKCSLKDVRDLLKDIVTKVHQEDIDKLPEPSRADASFELLSAVWVKDEGVRLIRTGRGFSLLQPTRCAIGWGDYLADYLFATYAYDNMGVRKCTRLITYVIAEVSKHAQYCGGPSQIMTIGNDGEPSEMHASFKSLDERSCAIAVEGASSLLNQLDPVGFGLDLTKIDQFVDIAAGFIKQRLHQTFEKEFQVLKPLLDGVSQPATQDPSSPKPDLTPQQPSLE
jgi:hypothetical protein